VDLDEALSIFRRGKSPMSSRAREIISEALGEVARSDFRVVEDYVFDADDIFHVHPTMIVARRAFPGSRDNGPKPYPLFPHRRELPEFVVKSAQDKGPKIAYATCPERGVQYPKSVKCPYCDVSHP